MDRDYLERLHNDLCAMSIELSRQCLAMPESDPDYYRLNTMADRVDSARRWAHAMLKPRLKD